MNRKDLDDLVQLVARLKADKDDADKQSAANLILKNLHDNHAKELLALQVENAYRELRRQRVPVGAAEGRTAAVYDISERTVRRIVNGK